MATGEDYEPSESVWDYCVPPRKTSRNPLDTVHPGCRCAMNMPVYQKYDKAEFNSTAV